MQNLGTLQQLSLGDLADDGRERGENNAQFNGHFVALAHALRSDQNTVVHVDQTVSGLLPPYAMQGDSLPRPPLPLPAVLNCIATYPAMFHGDASVVCTRLFKRQKTSLKNTMTQPIQYSVNTESGTYVSMDKCGCDLYIYQSQIGKSNKVTMCAAIRLIIDKVSEKQGLLAHHG